MHAVAPSFEGGRFLSLCGSSQRKLAFSLTVAGVTCSDCARILSETARQKGLVAPCDWPQLGMWPQLMLADRIVYFAHSLRDYARDLHEVRAAMAGRGYVLDPERIDWAGMAKETCNETVFETVVSVADEVVVLEHEGFIGKGVYTEVVLALAAGKPVYVWRGELIQVLGACVVDPKDWALYYARLCTTRPAFRQGVAALSRYFRAP